SRLRVRTAPYVFSAQRVLVAQICNLPYRRFVIGRASETSSALELADVPQNAILRYSRLQICATLNIHGVSPFEATWGGAPVEHAHGEVRGYLKIRSAFLECVIADANR